MRKMMKLNLLKFNNSRAFLEEVGEELYSRETINNLILGVCERLVNDPESYTNPFFAAIKDEGGNILLSAVMTPPHNMILAGCQDFDKGLSTLIAYLQESPLNLPGVIGPAHISENFVKQWEHMTSETGEIKIHQRVYELRSVRMPPLPEGHFRVAFIRDSPLISEWLQAFSEEALGEDTGPTSTRAKEMIADGKIFVWEKAGEIVSMAMKARPIAHAITISGVYTPPEVRRNGYATALVARLSQHLLDSGYQFINLFTDLGNPTSNKIYQNIGYHPVGDFRMYKFHKKKFEVRE
jgi:uncharacterized protein